MTNQENCGHTPLFAEDSIRWVERVLPCLYCERDRLRAAMRDHDTWLANTGHGADHPWRLSIARALGSAPEPSGGVGADEFHVLRILGNDQISAAKARELIEALRRGERPELMPFEAVESRRFDDPLIASLRNAAEHAQETYGSESIARIIREAIVALIGNSAEKSKHKPDFRCDNYLDCSVCGPEKSSEPSEDEAARLDRAYRDGARQAASMAHQSLRAMDDWIAGGCGNRCSPLKSGGES